MREDPGRGGAQGDADAAAAAAHPLRDTICARRAILHVDMDAFFAAVEVLDDPSLRGRPVIVGGTPEGRGVVAAASYEARRFGVHSAMSAARARRLCPRGVFLRPRGRRYAEISAQIFAVFRDFTPMVEPLSVDEAFLDVTGCQRLFGPAAAIGRAIKDRVREEIGLIASVGVAPNKFLAKLASDLEKPDGFVVIEESEIAERLAPLPVSRLWGVGRVTEQALARRGVRSVCDLLACDPAALEVQLGAAARTLRELAMGRDDRPVAPEGEQRSYGAEITFARDVQNAQELREALDELTERVGGRLRSDGLAARTVHVKARYPDFTTVTRAVTLPEPTALTTVLREAARDLLDRRLERRGRPLRLLGVSVSRLEPVVRAQGELFGDPGREKAAEIDLLVDRVQDRFGRALLRRGARRRPADRGGAA